MEMLLGATADGEVRIGTPVSFQSPVVIAARARSLWLVLSRRKTKTEVGRWVLTVVPLCSPCTFLVPGLAEGHSLRAQGKGHVS